MNEETVMFHSHRVLGTLLHVMILSLFIAELYHIKSDMLIQYIVAVPLISHRWKKQTSVHLWQLVSKGLVNFIQPQA